MTRALVATLLMLAFGADSDGDKQAAPPRPPFQGTITFHQQIMIVRTQPVGTAGAAAPGSASAIRWDEHRGPRCVPLGHIAGVARLSQDSVDLVLRDNSRVRARLERRCPALDYYSGFYLAATPDGMLCADRDSIRARTGGQCGIDRFRSLSMSRHH